MGALIDKYIYIYYNTIYNISIVKKPNQRFTCSTLSHVDLNILSSHGKKTDPTWALIRISTHICRVLQGLKTFNSPIAFFAKNLKNRSGAQPTLPVQEAVCLKNACMNFGTPYTSWSPGCGMLGLCQARAQGSIGSQAPVDYYLGISHRYA